ncbi:MAG: CHAT domain-containing protein [Acidobacteria bacterium]|nr:CHAT domain-containing protein [Acidobacteriota bacterium]
MNSIWYKQKAQSHQQEIAKLQTQKAQETARVHDFQKRSNDAANKAARAASVSSVNSYMREAQRYSEQAVAAQQKVASIEQKLAQEYQRLTEAQKNAANEEKRESDSRRREEERRANDEKRKAEARRREEQRREREREYRMQSIDNTLSHHEVLHRTTLSAIDRLSQLPEEIKVLFMAANPLDQPQLRLDEEVRAINEMITKSRHRDSVKLESRWAVRPLDVLHALNELQPPVVHFSGHGSDEDEIVFQDNEGQTKLVSKEAIVQTMAAVSGVIQLVFFNTCYSRNQAEAVVKHVPAAIGMKTTIGDTAARIFAGQFYSAIGFGLSVKQAFDQAKAALMLENIREEDTPELFVGDGVDAESLILVKPPGA